MIADYGTRRAGVKAVDRLLWIDWEMARLRQEDLWERPCQIASETHEVGLNRLVVPPRLLVYLRVQQSENSSAKWFREQPMELFMIRAVFTISARF